MKPRNNPGAGRQILAIIGPWDTAAVRRPTPVVGGVDFGPRSLIDIDEAILQFFDAQFRSERTRDAKPSLRLFATGRNEWIGGEEWPKSLTDCLEFYLRSGGAANTRRGDGVLGDTSPASAEWDEMTHNPAMPVDFQPYFTSFAAGSFVLTLDQGHITARDEALVYTSTPLKDTFSVLGRPTLTVTVRTDAPDADLFVLLSDCFPFGSRDLHLSHAAIPLGDASWISGG